MAITFKGRKIVHPGAYDNITSVNGTTTVTQGYRIPVIIGEAVTGECGVLKFFTSPEQAKQYLSGGDLYDCMDLVFSPTTQGGGGCSKVGVVVANKTLPSGLVVEDGFTLKSKIHGEISNRISVSVTDGRLLGTKKVLVSKWDDNTLEVFDSIGGVLQVLYTGSDEYCSVSVEGTGGKATKLVFKAGTDSSSATEDLAIELSNERFTSVGQLASYISSISKYKATVPEQAVADIKVESMDIVSEVEIQKDRGIILTAMDEDFKNRLNTYSELVLVEEVTEVANMEYTYLTGGSNGVAPQSWTPYFNEVKKSSCKVMVLATSNISVQAEAVSYISQLEAKGLRMTMFTGGAIGETIEQVKNRANILNSSRAYLVNTGGYSHVNDSTRLLPGYVISAMLAGRKCGVRAVESITFEYFNLVSLETSLIPGDTEVDELIEAGVCVLEKVDGRGIRLAHAISTCTSSSAPIDTEMSVRMGADDLSERITRKLEDKFVGKNGNTTTGVETSIKVATTDELEQAIKDEEIYSYGNITVSRVGTAFYVEYEASIAMPTNFVLVSSKIITE